MSRNFKISPVVVIPISVREVEDELSAVVRAAAVTPTPAITGRARMYSPWQITVGMEIKGWIHEWCLILIVVVVV